MSQESYAPEVGAASGIGMPGYVIRDESTYLWLQDKLSTWMIGAQDVLAREAWEGVAGSGISGTPQIVSVREGAEIYQVNPAILTISERPLVLGDLNKNLTVLGASVVEELARNSVFNMDAGWLNRVKTLGVDGGAPAGAAPPPRPTYSMAPDTGWGIVCKKDD